jgi:hypothetical protein
MVVLGLYWEHRQQRSPTSVNHIMEVLKGLGVISESDINLLHDRINGQPFQRKLYNHCRVVIGGISNCDNDSWISCRQNLSVNQKVYLQSLVSMQHIRLLSAGERAAIIFEETYRGILNKEKYLAKSAKLANSKCPA